MFTRLYGFETVVIRYFNVFGPRQDPGSPYSGVISLFATALIEGRQPTIFGDGEQTRDFTYVANVVDGVLRACEAPKAAGEAINVACGTRISLNELLRVMNTVVGTDLQRDLQGGARGRRQGFAGRHHQGQNAARLHAARRARRRAPPYAGVVPVADRRRGQPLSTPRMSIEVEVNMRIPGLTLRAPNEADKVINNSYVRFTKLIQVPAIPKAGDPLTLTTSTGQTFESTVTQIRLERGSIALHRLVQLRQAIDFRRRIRRAGQRRRVEDEAVDLAHHVTAENAEIAENPISCDLCALGG